jgi:hypothetical protein
MSSLPKCLLEDKNYKYDLIREYESLGGPNDEQRIIFDKSNNQGKKNIVDALKIKSFMENAAQIIESFVRSENLTPDKNITFDISLKAGEVTYRSYINIG